MYRIAVCDDEDVFRKSMISICKRTLGKMGVPHEVDGYASAHALLARFTGDPARYDFFLLDILMEGLDGIELARRIRGRNGSAAVVFLTASPDFVFRGYDVQALHYLLKPIDTARLSRLIRDDCSRRLGEEFVLLDNGRDAARIPIGEIVYLEIRGRKVAVHLKTSVVLLPGKLSDLLARLPGDVFVRSHQSFALNIRNVLELKQAEAVMQDGSRIPVSRAYGKGVRSAFLRTFDTNR